MTIVEFLQAQIAVDEEYADSLVGPDVVWPDDQRHQLDEWSERERKEVAAKRLLLGLHRPSTDHGDQDPYCVGCWEAGGMDGAPTYPCQTVRRLATVYSEREGYDSAWRP